MSLIRCWWSGAVRDACQVHPQASPPLHYLPVRTAVIVSSTRALRASALTATVERVGGGTTVKYSR